ncbi:heavy-metal-associated domain-containing protein [Marinobacter salicampi]|uniref:heavy-metal-associated domain-containing protein n=1 Tax=Marinobacter salicampi TaxID=435907 RepID=UPI001A94F8CF|nr:heavy-metal-associated domain-containing protein [Marinobacter salicampi]
MSEKAEPDSKKSELIVPGMGSDHCAGIIRHTLQRLEGVDEVVTNVASHRVRVVSASNGPDETSLRSAVEGAGYEVASISSAGETSHVMTPPSRKPTCDRPSAGSGSPPFPPRRSWF